MLSPGRVEPSPAQRRRTGQRSHRRNKGTVLDRHGQPVMRTVVPRLQASRQRAQRQNNRAPSRRSVLSRCLKCWLAVMRRSGQSVAPIALTPAAG